MSKSLQDQLMALGLAKEQVSKPARPGSTGGKKSPDKNSANKHQHGAGRNTQKHSSAANHRPEGKPAARPKSEQDISLEQAYRIRESQEKSEKLKQRERKLEEDRQRAALNRQIRQIVEAGRLNLPDASEARYFMYKERIRKIHVSAEQLQELNSGKLGVVYLAGGYHLLNMEQVEAVRKLSPTHVPELLTGEADDEELWAAESAAQDEADAAQDDNRDADQSEEQSTQQSADPKFQPAEAAKVSAAESTTTD